MKYIDEIDKKSLFGYIEFINKDQNRFNVLLWFKISQVDDSEYCVFEINGRILIKDNLEEAIAFLDGLRWASDIILNENL